MENISIGTCLSSHKPSNLVSPSLHSLSPFHHIPVYFPYFSLLTSLPQQFIYPGPTTILIIHLLSLICFSWVIPLLCLTFYLATCHLTLYFYQCAPMLFSILIMIPIGLKCAIHSISAWLHIAYDIEYYILNNKWDMCQSMYLHIEKVGQFTCSH